MNRSLYRLILAVLSLTTLAACSTADAKQSKESKCAAPAVEIAWAKGRQRTHAEWAVTIQHYGKRGDMAGVKGSIAQRDSALASLDVQMDSALKAAKLADSATVCK